MPQSSKIRRRSPKPHYGPAGFSHLTNPTSIGAAFSFVLLIAFGALLRWGPKNCPIDASLLQPYNTSYPFTPAALSKDGSEIIYRIVIVTDLDENSKSTEEENTWMSFIRFGTLFLKKDYSDARIVWDPKAGKVKGGLSQGGRAMELSDLKVLDGHLIAVDDRTGVLFRMTLSDNEKGTSPSVTPIPWVLLNDGSGNISKGFKAEWMTVKDDELYVGGLGKEWTTIYGEYRNMNPMWVKIVNRVGYVTHKDWTSIYKKLRNAAGIYYPGYMIHEAAQWSKYHKKWFFLPRRASPEIYTEATDERKGTNHIVIADEDFEKIDVRRVGDLIPTRGFSAFQFIPGTKDSLIIALKSEEDRGNIGSYATVFEANNGRILLQDSKLEGNYKFEGLEFV